MSSIPAWKRAGLSVQQNKTEEDENDLLETRRIDTADLTKNQLKKVGNKRKLQEALGKTNQATNKKPPKRIKLPKSERKPPPVKDQYTYLKQFVHDKSNWKFNKLKQNWILKNILSIPMEYELELVLYLSTLQGGSRDRLVDELKQVIEKWNVKYEEMERKIEEKLLNGEKKMDDAGEEQKKEVTEMEESKKEQKEENQDELNLEYVVRCKAILGSLIDERIEVKGYEESTKTDGESELSRKSVVREDDDQLESESKVEAEHEVDQEKKEKKEKKDKKDKKEKRDKKEKKDKSNKKDKKDKSNEKRTSKSESPADASDTSNLIINEVEV